jgi:hypothetical protein
MGRATYARLDRLAGKAGRRLAFQVQRAWRVPWSGATGRVHRIRRPADVPPEMLLLYRSWRTLLAVGLRAIEREVGSHRADWKHLQWQRWVRRCRRDPAYNWRTNRIEPKRRRRKR